MTNQPWQPGKAVLHCLKHEEQAMERAAIVADQCIYQIMANAVMIGILHIIKRGE